MRRPKKRRQKKKEESEKGRRPKKEEELPIEAGENSGTGDPPDNVHPCPSANH